LLLFKLFGIQKSKIICYQSARVNRIDSILLSRNYERSLESQLGRNEEVKRARDGKV
jgi:hypothetical protein